MERFLCETAARYITEHYGGFVLDTKYQGGVIVRHKWAGLALGEVQNKSGPGRL